MLPPARCDPQNAYAQLGGYHKLKTIPRRQPDDGNLPSLQALYIYVTACKIKGFTMWILTDLTGEAGSEDQISTARPLE